MTLRRRGEEAAAGAQPELTPTPPKLPSITIKDLAKAQITAFTASLQPNAGIILDKRKKEIYAAATYQHLGVTDHMDHPGAGAGSPLGSLLPSCGYRAAQSSFPPALLQSLSPELPKPSAQDAHSQTTPWAHLYPDICSTLQVPAVHQQNCSVGQVGLLQLAPAPHPHSRLASGCRWSTSRQ